MARIKGVTKSEAKVEVRAILTYFGGHLSVISGYVIRSPSTTANGVNSWSRKLFSDIMCCTSIPRTRSTSEMSER